MRVDVDSSDSTTRPLTFSLERSSSSVVDRARPAAASQLGGDDPQRLGEVVGARAEVEADLARCRRSPGENE